MIYKNRLLPILTLIFFLSGIILIFVGYKNRKTDIL